MKSILLEIVWTMSAIVLWTVALPLAAFLFVAATTWNKTVSLLIGEPLTPAPARMSRAAA